MCEWNPWHGCTKLSAGCQNCYVYRRDAMYDKSGGDFYKTKNFELPIKRDRRGEYKIAPGSRVFTCFTSDFFYERADELRSEAWRMIRERRDLEFFIVTKRIHRFLDCIPPDWRSGYPNVEICCTVENSEEAERRLPIFLSVPIAKKSIICEPLLEEIDLRRYLTSEILSLTAGGESGEGVRICDYDWVLSLRSQCRDAGVPFTFKQTGARFKKDGKIYNIPRQMQHSQAKRARIDT